MNNQSFTTTILVDNSPSEVFNAINNVRGWWSEEIEGSTNKLNDEWNYHYQDVHRCKMKIVEFIPGKKNSVVGDGQLFQFHKRQKRMERQQNYF